MQEKTYEINGKKYTQRPLVLGQVRQLLNLLKDTTIPTDAGALALIDALGDKLPNAIAIVLNEDGMSLKNRDISSLAEEFEFSVTPDVALEVIDHFFVLNPIASLLSRIGNMVEKIGTEMTPTKEESEATS